MNYINQVISLTVKALIGSENRPIIYEGVDELLSRTQSYGTHEKPEDYLESFNDFILNQLNESVALTVVVNKPKDLTRAQLKEVRLLLDQHGFSEVKLKTAWRNKTNQEIAASIIGYIRQQPLVAHWSHSNNVWHMRWTKFTGCIAGQQCNVNGWIN